MFPFSFWKSSASYSYLFIDNQFNSNNTQGFSVRQLHPDVTNCMLVRRSSDNAELLVGFKNNLIDVDAITDFALGTDDIQVIQWYNQNPNSTNINMYQPSSGLAPFIALNGSVLYDSSGYPAIYFDSNSFLRLANNSSYISNPITQGNNFNIFIAAEATGDGIRAIASTHVNNQRHLEFDYSVDPLVQATSVYDGTTTYTSDYSKAYAANEKFILTTLKRSNTISSFDNLNSGTTYTYDGTYFNSGFLLGRRFTYTTNNAFIGYMNEFIGYIDNLGNRESVTENMMNYYEIN